MRIKLTAALTVLLLALVGCGTGFDGQTVTPTPSPSPAPEPTPTPGEAKLGVSIDDTTIANVYIIDLITGAPTELVVTDTDTGIYFEIDIDDTLDANRRKLICLNDADGATQGVFGHTITNTGLYIGASPESNTALSVATSTDTTRFADVGITLYYPTDTTDLNTRLNIDEATLTAFGLIDTEALYLCSQIETMATRLVRLTTYNAIRGCPFNQMYDANTCAFAGFSYTNWGYYLDISPNSSGVCPAANTLVAPGNVTDTNGTVHPAGEELSSPTCTNRGVGGFLLSNYENVAGFTGTPPSGRYTATIDGTALDPIQYFSSPLQADLQNVYLPIVSFRNNGTHITHYMIRGWMINDGTTTETITDNTLMASIFRDVTLDVLTNVTTTQTLTNMVDTDFVALDTPAKIANINNLYISVTDNYNYALVYSFRLP